MHAYQFYAIFVRMQTKIDMKLNQTIEFHIRTTSLALSRMYNAIAEDYGITQTIGYILTYVDKEGTPSTKIATQLGMKKSSLTRVLKKMEEDGCIIREIDKVDKRVVKIFLTEKGIERRKIAKKTVIVFNNRLNDMVEKGDLERFSKVSEIIKQLVNEELERRHIK